MKVIKKSETPNFIPFQLNIVVETKEELEELWARFNTADYKLAWSDNVIECRKPITGVSAVFPLLNEELEKYNKHDSV